MDLRVNGESKTFDDSANLASLLKEMDVRHDATGVAVALNDVVIPRAEWPMTPIASGDTIEIIRAVQGG